MPVRTQSSHEAFPRYHLAQASTDLAPARSPPYRNQKSNATRPFGNSNQPSTRYNRDSRTTYNSPRDQLSNADYDCRLKKTTSCVMCGNFGHWYADHLPDGSLASTTRSSDSPQPHHVGKHIQDLRREQGDPVKSIVVFKMATCTDPSNATILYEHVSLGPMVDNLAPYSSIRFTEL